jgi:hypothetical protein
MMGFVVKPYFLFNLLHFEVSHLFEHAKIFQKFISFICMQ